MNLSKATIDRLEYNLRNVYDDRTFMCHLMEDDEDVSFDMLVEFQEWLAIKLTAHPDEDPYYTLDGFLRETDQTYSPDSENQASMHDPHCFQARLNWWDKQIETERRKLK